MLPEPGTRTVAEPKLLVSRLENEAQAFYQAAFAYDINTGKFSRCASLFYPKFSMTGSSSMNDNGPVDIAYMTVGAGAHETDWYYIYLLALVIQKPSVGSQAVSMNKSSSNIPRTCLRFFLFLYLHPLRKRICANKCFAFSELLFLRRG